MQQSAMASRQSIRRSAKSWKFESNDFLTTPAVNGGCPAGLVPIYRAYNNGFARGVDSNHRITSSYSAYLQTVAAGSIGEGVVMCAPARPPGIVTAVGVATGGAASATIGAAGGSVSSPDGKLVLTIPAGALAADTLIGIQPLTNQAPGKIGAAYRLTPDGQTFLQPVTLRFTYTDNDLLGTAAEFLGAAFQTADGHWQWLGAATVDTTAKTVSVGSTHFTDISLVKGLQIRPASATVPVNGTVAFAGEGLLQRRDLFGSTTNWPPLAHDCDNTDQGIVSTLSVNEWSVNGRLGGGGVFGKVFGSGASGNLYGAGNRTHSEHRRRERARAQPAEGTDREDAVGVDHHDRGRLWTGTASGADRFWTVSVDVTWTLDSFVGNVASFSPTGTATHLRRRHAACTARFNPSTRRTRSRYRWKLDH